MEPLLEWDALTIDGQANGTRTGSLSELGDIFEALERLPVPIFAIDRNMTIRWLNRASRELIGEREGERFTDVLEPGSIPVANQAFAQKIVGSVASTEYKVTVRKRDGTLVRAEISSVPIRGDQSIAGVFGLATIDEEAPPQRAADSEVSLTPRQAQVLHLLARGCSTDQMADQLGLAQDTIRNHVRAILRRLGVHSRLEAVIEAHQRGLV
ncbi:MAG TPA: LuxR C-terminal-related transcriptional regulator [Gaiellaceae bacterium]